MDRITTPSFHCRGRLGYEGLDPTWLTRWDKPHVLWKFLLLQELQQHYYEYLPHCIFSAGYFEHV